MEFHPLKYLKAILYFLLVMAPVSSLLAQGQLFFGNHFTGILHAPVYGPDPNNPFQSGQGNTAIGLPAGTQTYGGPLLAGTGYTIALFALAADSYVEIARGVFRTGAASGLTPSLNVSVPNHPPGSSVTLVVRAWENQGFTITTWEQALADTAILIGQSAPFSVDQLGGYFNGTIFNLPSTLGVRSFNIYSRGGAFVVAQPEDVIVPAGASAQMHVEVVSSIGTPSFQWQRNAADIPGATGATLVLTNIQYADAGGYRAIATFSSLTLTSRVARLTVQPRIADIDHFFIPEWGADAVRLSYDSMPLLPVRVEVRSTLLDTWINMGQFVNPNVRSYFFDIGPTNDMRFYRLSLDP
jgi:hypothetical protein